MAEHYKEGREFKQSLDLDVRISNFSEVAFNSGASFKEFSISHESDLRVETYFAVFISL